jgi:Ni2+-binding GTPase involved in maturation of urease and hydrogenase
MNLPEPPSHTHPQKARYIMLGGFLGAGKTTAVAQLAYHLKAQGFRVGLITNDQGSDLVDTAMLRSKGFKTEEISGGCFCCRFNSLVDAADRLTAATRPDVFIAEPVGSCTDLVATVTYPLRRIYGEQFAIAPLSVLVDPIRAERMLGLTDGPKFSEKVQYIYRKQLEEADIVVVTKSDLLDASRQKALEERLTASFPHAQIRAVSVREGTGTKEWFEHLSQAEQGYRATIGIDYETYAEGESLLGWLNATLQITALVPVDSTRLLRGLAGEIQRRLAPAEIAHLKMTLSPDGGLGDIAAVNLVRSDYIPELSLTLEEPITSAQVILNLRAEADPALLKAAVADTCATLGQAFHGVRAQLEHAEHFRPGKPEPTHRDASPLSRP